MKIKCDDCGLWARENELQDREPHLGGVRHRKGFGCWPKKQMPIKTFGQFAWVKRIEAGKTQQECADALRLKSKSSVHQLETGKRNWKLDQVSSFAKLLGLPASKLLAEYEAIKETGAKQ